MGVILHVRCHCSISCALEWYYLNQKFDVQSQVSRAVVH